jgi:hypothetical protein
VSDTQDFIGFVARLSTKAGNSKRGAWTLYSAKIEKKDGTEYDDWLSLGFKDPGVKEGDYIKVSATKKDGRWSADISTLQKSKNTPARASRGSQSADYQSGQSGTSSGYARGGGNRYDGTGIQNRTNPEDAKRMTYQSSRGQAIELLKLLLEVDGLPITKAATKAGESKRFDELNAAADKLTIRFYNDALSLRLLGTVADTVPDTKPDGELPDKEEGNVSEEGQATQGADEFEGSGAGSGEFDDDIPF